MSQYKTHFQSTSFTFHLNSFIWCTWLKNHPPPIWIICLTCGLGMSDKSKFVCLWNHVYNNLLALIVMIHYLFPCFHIIHFTILNILFLEWANIFPLFVEDKWLTSAIMNFHLGVNTMLPKLFWWERFCCWYLYFLSVIIAFASNCNSTVIGSNFIGQSSVNILHCNHLSFYDEHCLVPFLSFVVPSYKVSTFLIHCCHSFLFQDETCHKLLHIVSQAPVLMFIKKFQKFLLFVVMSMDLSSAEISIQIGMVMNSLIWHCQNIQLQYHLWFV